MCHLWLQAAVINDKFSWNQVEPGGEFNKYLRHTWIKPFKCRIRELIFQFSLIWLVFEHYECPGSQSVICATRQSGTNDTLTARDDIIEERIFRVSTIIIFYNQ